MGTDEVAAPAGPAQLPGRSDSQRRRSTDAGATIELPETPAEPPMKEKRAASPAFGSPRPKDDVATDGREEPRLPAAVTQDDSGVLTAGADGFHISIQTTPDRILRDGNTVALPSGAATKILELRQRVAKRAGLRGVEDASLVVVPPDAFSPPLPLDGRSGRDTLQANGVESGAVIRLLLLPDEEFTLMVKWRGTQIDLEKELRVTLQTTVAEVEKMLDGAFRGLKGKQVRLTCEGKVLTGNMTLMGAGVDGFDTNELVARRRSRANTFLLVLGFVFMASVTVGITVASTKLREIVDQTEFANGQKLANQAKDQANADVRPWFAKLIIALTLLPFAFTGSCCWSPSLDHWGEGFSVAAQRRWRLIAYALFFVLLCIVLAVWWCNLVTVHENNKILSTMTDITLQALREVDIIIGSLKVLLVEAPPLLRGSGVALPEIGTEPLDQAWEMANMTRGWAPVGAAAVRGVFTMYILMAFLGLQLVLLILAMGVPAVFRQRSGLCMTNFWASWTVLIIFCFGHSVSLTINIAVEITSKLTHAMTGGGLENYLECEKDSPIIQVMHHCSDKGDATLNLDFLGAVVGGAGEGPMSSFTSIDMMPTHNATIADLRNWSSYIGPQIIGVVSLFANADDNEELLNDLGHLLPANQVAMLGNLAPLCQYALATLESVLSLIDCSLVRQGLGSINNILRNGVEPALDNLSDCEWSMNYFLCVTIILFGILRYVLDRPWKHFYCAETNRYFRFPFAFHAHRQLEGIGLKEGWRRVLIINPKQKPPTPGEKRMSKAFSPHPSRTPRKRPGTARSMRSRRSSDGRMFLIGYVELEKLDMEDHRTCCQKFCQAMACCCCPKKNIQMKKFAHPERIVKAEQPTAVYARCSSDSKPICRVDPGDDMNLLPLRQSSMAYVPPGWNLMAAAEDIYILSLVACVMIICQVCMIMMYHFSFKENRVSNKLLGGVFVCGVAGLIHLFSVHDWGGVDETSKVEDADQEFTKEELADRRATSLKRRDWCKRCLRFLALALLCVGMALVGDDTNDRINDILDCVKIYNERVQSETADGMSWSGDKQCPIDGTIKDIQVVCIAMSVICQIALAIFCVFLMLFPRISEAVLADSDRRLMSRVTGVEQRRWAAMKTDRYANAEEDDEAAEEELERMVETFGGDSPVTARQHYACALAKKRVGDEQAEMRHANDAHRILSQHWGSIRETPPDGISRPLWWLMWDSGLFGHHNADGGAPPAADGAKRRREFPRLLRGEQRQALAQALSAEGRIAGAAADHVATPEGLKSVKDTVPPQGVDATAWRVVHFLAEELRQDNVVVLPDRGPDGAECPASPEQPGGIHHEAIAELKSIDKKHRWPFRAATAACLLATMVTVACAVSTETGGRARYNPALPEPTRCDDCCNGRVSNCDKRVHEVVFPTVHNAMSNQAYGWLLPNNYYPIDEALSAGYRGIMYDIYPHQTTNRTLLCHTACSLGSDPLVDGLRNITLWLEDNPREVIIFSLEVSRKLQTAALVAAFEASGMVKYMWAPASPPPGNGVSGSVRDSAPLPADWWPTLGEMIANDTRVVVMMDVVPAVGSPRWLLYEWAVSWETDYHAEKVTDFHCGITCGNCRGVVRQGVDGMGGYADYAAGKDHYENRIAHLHHFISAPIAAAPLAQHANKRDFLRNRGRDCMAEWQGHSPGLVAVDFWSVGGVLPAINDMLDEAEANATGANFTFTDEDENVTRWRDSVLAYRDHALSYLPSGWAL